MKSSSTEMTELGQPETKSQCVGLVEQEMVVEVTRTPDSNNNDGEQIRRISAKLASIGDSLEREYAPREQFGVFAILSGVARYWIGRLVKAPMLVAMLCSLMSIIDGTDQVEVAANNDAKSQVIGDSKWRRQN
eukprot:gene9221-10195_t